MSNLTLTLLIAFVVVSIAILALSIGWLWDRKNRLRLGQCGRNPDHKRDDHCGKDISCQLCKKNPLDEEKKK